MDISDHPVWSRSRQLCAIVIGQFTSRDKAAMLEGLKIQEIHKLKWKVEEVLQQAKVRNR